MISARDALERLREGNRRFAAGEQSSKDLLRRPEHSPSSDEQHPFAIIFGCSDSRVPAEIVFEQGLGDLFVIRVAGNIVAPSLIGSVEFAASKFGTRLVVVLGHSYCGAVQATLDSLKGRNSNQSTNLASITNRIRPAVESLAENNNSDDPATIIGKAVRANVEASVAQLKNGSEILQRLISDDGLKIVGAEYSLETGLVEFLDGGTG